MQETSTFNMEYSENSELYDYSNNVRSVNDLFTISLVNWKIINDKKTNNPLLEIGIYINPGKKYLELTKQQQDSLITDLSINFKGILLSIIKSMTEPKAGYNANVGTLFHSYITMPNDKEAKTKWINKRKNIVFSTLSYLQKTHSIYSKQFQNLFLIISHRSSKFCGFKDSTDKYINMQGVEFNSTLPIFEIYKEKNQEKNKKTSKEESIEILSEKD